MLTDPRTTRSSNSGGCTSRLAAAVVAFSILVSGGTACSFAGVDLLRQGSPDAVPSLVPTSSRNSLLDPSALRISHQVVFSYSSGSGAGDGTGALWLTNLHYRFSSPLTMDVAVGSLLSHSGVQGLQSQSLFLERLSLQYRPSENFYFHLMYRDVPRNVFWLPWRRPY